LLFTGTNLQVQELQHTNASLVGHTNIKQKIKQHEKLKDEVSHSFSAVDTVLLLQNTSAQRWFTGCILCTAFLC
jgi:hypothetical protein